MSALRTAGVPDSSAVFHEILAELARIEQGVSSDPTFDERTKAEGRAWAFSLLRVALDTQVWAHPHRPRFTDIVWPYAKWGGDNADAYFCFTPLDPERTYLITGQRADAAYMSLTLYGGPDDGRYAERIVATANDRTLRFGADGSFELILSPDDPPRDSAANWLRLESDVVCAITRDYLVAPETSRRATWRIECLDAPDDPPRETDADLARRFTAALTWLREQSTLVLPLVEENDVAEPYPVPTTTFGWAAGDAAYAMGSFDLRQGEALIIEGRSPECAFWNMCLWNPFQHTYDYAWERVTINGGQVEYEPDGSWRIVISATDPGMPNWVSTAGHERGRIWFRWFLPDHTPERPLTKVIRV
ncbi:hypothetical protein C1I98_18225 [Spongiactinospora gelatinilytica]|uniref:DUF1214 domain-containing protein n=1 Tax=Spongiactinospora gelatinilytica TaxID=2666298 RepID=A0A2W2H248_9ACTN|nr:DUF1214 domain-containing protein [Spongiactinospora gelatinilytica]PZG43628.1 hypothetical protein C1I98_18225 [Spongiactinospora gelatinilytica]